MVQILNNLSTGLVLTREKSESPLGKGEGMPVFSFEEFLKKSGKEEMIPAGSTTSQTVSEHSNHQEIALPNIKAHVGDLALEESFEHVLDFSEIEMHAQGGLDSPDESVKASIRIETSVVFGATGSDKDQLLKSRDGGAISPASYLNLVASEIERAILLSVDSRQDASDVQELPKGFEPPNEIHSLMAKTDSQEGSARLEKVMISDSQLSEGQVFASANQNESLSEGLGATLLAQQNSLPSPPSDSPESQASETERDLGPIAEAISSAVEMPQTIGRAAPEAQAAPEDTKPPSLPQDIRPLAAMDFPLRPSVMRDGKMDGLSEDDRPENDMSRPAGMFEFGQTYPLFEAGKSTFSDQQKEQGVAHRAPPFVENLSDRLAQIAPAQVKEPSQGLALQPQDISFNKQQEILPNTVSFLSFEKEEPLSTQTRPAEATAFASKMLSETATKPASLASSVLNSLPQVIKEDLKQVSENLRSLRHEEGVTRVKMTLDTLGRVEITIRQDALGKNIIQLRLENITVANQVGITKETLEDFMSGSGYNKENTEFDFSGFQGGRNSDDPDYEKKEGLTQQEVSKSATKKPYSHQYVSGDGKLDIFA